jgi:hypothetical protein
VDRAAARSSEDLTVDRRNDRRADLVVWSPTGRPVVIELQHSALTLEQLERRAFFYAGAGAAQNWLQKGLNDVHNGALEYRYASRRWRDLTLWGPYRPEALRIDLGYRAAAELGGYRYPAGPTPTFVGVTTENGAASCQALW